MSKNRATRLLWAFISLFFLLTSTPAIAEEEGPVKVTEVQIVGNKKVEPEAIRSKISVKPGDVFSPSSVRNDIATIYKMGFFDDVRVDAEGASGGIRLIFNVVERPLITSFSFEGNKNIETSKIREKVNLSPYSVYNPSLVAENVEKIKLFYQGEGYYNATVLPIIKESAKDVKVIFQIDEGSKVIISKMNFVGNSVFSDRKIRKVMVTKPYFPVWSWLMKTGTYKVVEFSQDMERIKALYYNNGYIQVMVGEPQILLSQDKKKLEITIPITEGAQFRYRNIDVSGNTVFKKDELLKNVTSKPGEIMDRDKLKQDVVALTDLYGTKGYAFASISPVINPDPEKKLVDINLDVNEGDQIFVNRINIMGNVKTRDKVIRRELKFNEGDIYDTSSLKKSYDRLKNLDFFEDMEIVPARRDQKDIVDLNVKVKEKSTGSFSIGGGYSTIDRLMAIGEVTQNNFLGLGEQLKFKGQFGKRSQDFNFSFTEPWLLDMPISFRVDLFKEMRVYNGYTKKTLGGALTLGRRFWEYYSISGGYSYTDDKYSSVLETFQDEFSSTLDLHSTSKVTANLSRDTRDNYLDTRHGSSNSIYGEYAGLGGQNHYYKAIGDTTWFFPFYWETAFSLHGRIGYASGISGTDLPVAERFLVGGISTVRGFNFGAIGPKVPIKKTDPVTGATVKKEGGQPIGGNKELIFNAEYTFPVVPALKLKGVAFFDAGRAFDNGESLGVGNLSYSAGAGFRWMSPMGLIRLEYGYVLNRKPGDKAGKLEFSMGSMF